MNDEPTDHIAAVKSRLAEKFPNVDTSFVQTTVDDALARLSGAKFTDFLPLLVERSATEKLRNAAS